MLSEYPATLESVLGIDLCTLTRNIAEKITTNGSAPITPPSPPASAKAERLASLRHHGRTLLRFEVAVHGPEGRSEGVG